MSDTKFYGNHWDNKCHICGRGFPHPNRSEYAVVVCPECVEKEECEGSDPKYEPSKLYYLEALDRSHVACDHFFEYVQQHPAVEHDAELREAAEKVVDVMQDFYQLVGWKYHEFEAKDDADI